MYFYTEKKRKMTGYFELTILQTPWAIDWLHYAPRCRNRLH